MPNVDGRGSSEDLDFSAARGTIVYEVLAAGGLAAYEPDTLALAAALIIFFDVKRFSDVGANIGLYSLVLSRLAQGRLQTKAFEPLPSLVRVLRLLTETNKLAISIVEAAVGDQAGEAVLHVSARSDASNSLNPTFRLAKAQIKVPLITLDADAIETDYFPQLIKIDTESTEPEVLRGAAHVIREHRPWIICEVLKGRTEEHLQTIIDEHQYTCYHVSGSSNLRTAEQIEGDETHQHRDWLFGPLPLPKGFNLFYRDFLTAFRKSGPKSVWSEH